MASAFFYGTLMHPKVLQRVINHEGAELQICPAVLLDYTRHKVKNAQYPGMIPYEQSRVLVDHKLSPEERSVRGTLVTGLSEMDIEELDEFEGTEYIRRVVNIHPLAPLIKLSEYATDEEALISPKQPSLPAPEVAPVKAETYVFVLFERLGSELWSFEDFIKNHAWKWYSEQPLDGDVRWAEVDEEDKKAGKN